MPFEPLHFNSKNGLLITADYYPVEQPKGFILLCHRSHCNRGEYRETAPKLNDLGYACLAIDQRSGMKVFGVVNETSTLAKQRGLATGYLDARQDIETAVDYAFDLNGNQPVIILGSSYSAALALLIANDTEKIKAIVTFRIENEITCPFTRWVLGRFRFGLGKLFDSHTLVRENISNG